MWQHCIKIIAVYCLIKGRYEVRNLAKLQNVSCKAKRRHDLKMRRQDYIETERTILRRLTIDDAEDFYALNLDKEVLKYTGDQKFIFTITKKEIINLVPHLKYLSSR